MPMKADGLVKLLEESGELQEVLCRLQLSLGRLQQAGNKKLAYFEGDDHPDGGPPLSRRLEDEMADILAATAFAAKHLKLDHDYITGRADAKLKLFEQWHTQP